MRLPAPIEAEISAALGPIQELQAVSGGCISSAARATIEGRPVMLKFDDSAPRGFFAVEAAGLGTLRDAPGGPLIPEVLAVSDPGGDHSWIALEWLDAADPGDRSSTRLGGELAQLHRVRADRWGWDRDGFIGSLPQSNAQASDWAAFWWERRLEPQLQRSGYGPVGAEPWNRLEAALPGLLAPADEDGPSLLHGDLWGGNVIHARRGPALVDPACYFGHREVDLAMSELFGGFNEAFYRAYAAEWPLLEGWRVRRQIYQLYYLLVHVNLFGSSYWSRTTSNLNGILQAMANE